MARKKLQTVTLERVTKRRGPGRPKKIPIEPKNEEVAQLMRNKRKHLDKSPLLNQLAEDPDSLNVLNLAMIELAKEAGSLDFERTEAERHGKSTSSISSKKINATKALIDTYLKKRDTIINESFDLKSKNFTLLFEFWVKKLQKAVVEAGFSEEMSQRFFNEMSKEFEDWEDAALKYIKMNS